MNRGLTCAIRRRCLSYFAHVRYLLRAVTFCLVSLQMSPTGNSASECFGSPSIDSAVDEVEPRIRELLREFPEMPATVIAERIGWARGITISRDRVAELRPLFVAPDPCQRTSYTPGELGQWDLWQPDALPSLKSPCAADRGGGCGPGGHRRSVSYPFHLHNRSLVSAGEPPGVQCQRMSGGHHRVFATKWVRCCQRSLKP